MGETVHLRQDAAKSLSQEDRMHQACDILADLFGFDSFRNGQEEVIRAVLKGRDTLAVMPTGGGKSLCYQIPALMEDGPTIVVSPLVSLMADQVASLTRAFAGAFGKDAKKAPAATINSSMSQAEQRRVESGLLDGSIKILLAAPERFRNLEFALMLKRIRPARFVVDEAHCVSEWGHSFRPEYLYLKRVMEDLGSVQTVALTATADPRVRGDIATLLGMREPELLVYGFDRPNLSYECREVTDERANAKPRRYEAVLAALEGGERPAIVYAHSRRQCESLAGFLTHGGVRAEAYHAGMAAPERDAVQEAFMDGSLLVVVATIAFGMGVDKPDILQVIHAYIPASIPAYVQESGRAGRDGEQAHCLVLFSKEEVQRRKQLSTCAPLTAADAEALFSALTEAGMKAQTGGGRLFPTPRQLDSMATLGPDEVGAVLRNLERVGALERRYNLWRDARVELVADARRGAGTETVGMSPAVSSVLKIMNREVRGNKSRKLSMSLTRLATEAGVTPPVAQGSLMSLAASGIITVSGRGTLSDVSLKVERLSRRDLVKLTAIFEEQAGVEALHMDYVEDYISSDTCRRQRILDYFGDQQADLIAPCGGCDVCRKGRKGRRGSPGGSPGTPSGSKDSLLTKALEKLSGIFRS